MNRNLKKKCVVTPTYISCYNEMEPGQGGGGVLPIMAYTVYGEGPPERGTFFRLQVYKRVEISQVRYIKG